MLKELVDDAAEHVRRVKIARCREQGRADIIPTVELIRGVRPVAVLWLNADPDTLLRDITAGIVGFDADAACLTTESYMRRPAGPDDVINPVTGKPWAYGDYQDVAEHHGGVEAGWVRETLMTLGVNRAGDFLSRVDPYGWQDDVPVFDGSGHSVSDAQGRFATVMRAAMNRPGLAAAVMRQVGADVLPDADRRDILTAQVLAPQINGALTLVSSSDDPARWEALGAAAASHPSFFRLGGEEAQP